MRGVPSSIILKMRQDEVVATMVLVKMDLTVSVMVAVVMVTGKTTIISVTMTEVVLMNLIMIMTVVDEDGGDAAADGDLDIERRVVTVRVTAVVLVPM